ncbi:inositol-3-phosphate synthase [Acidianus brierleyi]|uniref:L-myo-inositol-1-phosphate synthase n=1 Tax=Acidianus brierleyi TaxID=41673 RepID=A0A2U9IFL9_9CREN|nr:L-myo-inositol-1-phosphate synthase [Acidianus brierleyi]AWR94823.1 L-myo-inositol-1-phosphate synthase [Acidianus brierleyi]
MIRVALVGVGNVASALVQSLEEVKHGKEIPGILDLPFSPQDIEISAAFDIDRRKVGKTLSEAIFAKPNVVPQYTKVFNDVTVLRGPTLDGNKGSLSNIIEESEELPVDVSSILREERIDVVVNLLPTGVNEATLFYAKSSLESSTAFINASPTEVVRQLGKDFESKKVPLFGDDLISQIGGTIFHTGIIEFLKNRGVKINRSYQIDIAGNTETLITLEDWRKDLKKDIKSSYISSKTNGAQVVAGTSDYVEFLGDRRVSYMVIEGEYALGETIRVDISLKTHDAPNAVQPLIDLIRLAKLTRNKGIGGPIQSICGYYFKNSYKYGSIEEVKKDLTDFIRKLF